MDILEGWMEGWTPVVTPNIKQQQGRGLNANGSGSGFQQEMHFFLK